MPRREARGWATAALAGLAALTAAASLMLAGGPLEGRRERRDDTRRDDLERIAAQVRCLAEADDARLPARVLVTESCPETVRLTDPYDGAPYRYEVVDARSWRLCAGFELPLDRRQSWSAADVDPAAGCLVWHLAPPLEVKPATGD